MVKLLLGTKVHKILLQKYEENIKLNLAVKQTLMIAFVTFSRHCLRTSKNWLFLFSGFNPLPSSSSVTTDGSKIIVLMQ